MEISKEGRLMAAGVVWWKEKRMIAGIRKAVSHAEHAHNADNPALKERLRIFSEFSGKSL
jgi:hypothetical protein